MKSEWKGRYPLIFSALIMYMLSSSVHANIILYDWAFNVDGTYYEAAFGDSMPTTGSLDSNGLGTLTMDVSGTGLHTFISYFDYEMDAATNTYFNEYGTATGTTAAGQSWEIDEPFLFGDIYDNMLAGALDNSNNVPEGLNDDVAFALGWNFILDDFETAQITLNMADDLLAMDGNYFYLTHTDPDSNESVYFWSSLTITRSIPEPSSLALFSVMLVLLPFVKRRRH